jgi:hypothetical protein
MRPSVWGSWERDWGGPSACACALYSGVWGGDLKESLVCVHPCVGRWGGYAPSLAVANMTMCMGDALMGAWVCARVAECRALEAEQSFLLGPWHCRCTSR